MKTLEVTGLSQIASRYDVYVLDIFGVIHDGIELRPHILDVLQQLADHQKLVCFLSNAPQRSPYLIQRLEKFGLPKSLYQSIFTAGDQAHYFLKERSSPWHAQLGKNCYFIGDQTMEDVLPTFEYSHSNDIKSADFILVSGPDEWHKSLQDYEEILKTAAELTLPMVCANPDLFVFTGDQKEMRAGQIAARYQELGGDIFYHGKPYPRTYSMLLDQLSGTPKNRILVVGDSLLTDIVGANQAKLDSLLTASLTTQHELNTANLSFTHLINSITELEHLPTYFCSPLRW